MPIAPISCRSLDYLCLSHLFPPELFATHLDADRSGRFQRTTARRRRSTLSFTCPPTNVLLTSFQSFSGGAEVSDFMAVEEPADGSHVLGATR